MIKASELLNLFSAHWSTAILASGVEHAVFSHVSSGRRTLEEIAAATKIDARSMQALLDGLTGIGALSTSDGVHYENCEAAERFLIAGKPGYLGGFARIVTGEGDGGMQQWSRLPEAFRNGAPISPRTITAPDHPFWSELAMALQPVTEEVAEAVVQRFSSAERAELVLDVGGGTGAFALAWLRRSPRATVTQLDWAPMNVLAREQVAAAGVVDRFVAIDGDMHDVEWGEGHDFVVLSNVMHHEPPAANLRLLERARRALAPGGRVIVSEFALDDARSGPSFALRFHAGMILQTQHGASYRAADIADWVTRAGFSSVDTHAVPPLSTIITGVSG